MNEEQKQLLNRMIHENDTKDNTELIRNTKHSAMIRKSVSNIQNIKRRVRTNDFKTLDKEAMANGCGDLYTHYPNIYNKLLKNQIHIKTLYKFLDELERIEKGEKNQHEASFTIGTLLKEMYIDKRIDLEKENTGKETKKTKNKSNKGSTISYAEYKKQNNM